MTYNTYAFKGEIDWDIVPEEKLECWHWEETLEKTIRPNTYFKMCFLENVGIFARMRTDETNLRRVNTTPDSPVWEDSAMEFFFIPVESRQEYFNLEFNSNGAYLCHVGVAKKPKRKDISEFSKEVPVITPTVTKDGWSAEVFVPCKLVNEVLGENFEAKASEIRGNFYKCGDLTQIPHFGSYAPVAEQYPGFHNPICFANISIKEKA